MLLTSRPSLILCTALGAVVLFSGLPPTFSPATAAHVQEAWPALETPPPLEPPVRKLSVKLRAPDISALRGQFDLQLVRQNPWTGVTTFNTPEGTDVEQMARLLAQHPLVEWAEPVRWRRLFDLPRAPLTPNDTNYLSSQKWYYDLISAPGAWGIETGKASVTIAVLDSGVMCAHPDLVTNIWRNTKEIAGNGIDDDGNGFVDDVNGWDFVGAEPGAPEGPDFPGDADPCVKAGDPSIGNARDDDGDGVIDFGVSHGTLVAGIIAALSNNSVGVAGMCWNCTIMPVRIANPEGSIESSDLADGITYAAKNGAKVINVSLGGPRFSQAEQAAVNLAINAGAVVVAAAGNDNRNPVYFPAQMANVIAVGASDRNDPKGRAPFSNWGTGAANDRTVDVVAPGVDIVSTRVTSAAEEASGNGPAGSARYGRNSGTSFSAPLVSGLAGLLLSRNPALTPAQVKQIVRNSASPLPNDTDDRPDAGPQWAGAGMVNAQLALENLGQVPTPTATAIATPAPTGTPIAAPLPAGSKPQALSPATGITLQGLSTTLSWNNPAGATQYQIRVLPANNDGPAINLIRNLDTSYSVQGPVFGSGPYVMLPGMTYTWRIRTTTATTGIDENSPLWGTWSDDSTFKTRLATSTGITPVAPANGATAIGLTPAIRWANSDSDVFYYEIQLSRDPSFDTDPARATAMVYWELRHGAVTNPVNSYAVPANFPLQAGTTYFWRVRPRIQGDGVPVAWSTLFSFTSG